MVRTVMMILDFHVAKKSKNIVNRGYGWYGQLGHGQRQGQRDDHQLTPKKIEALADEVIVDVVCGREVTCAVTSTGSIFTCGDGTLTGHTNFDVIPRPTLLQDLSSTGVINVSANEHHTACVTTAGEVFTWGCYGSYGRLGHGDDNDQETPKRVEALVGVMAKLVSCGRYHTAICTREGHVYTFGHGQYGQLGYGGTKNKTFWFEPLP
jgi:alpha-tubulin suppressor-like RCC1 family protein